MELCRASEKDARMIWQMQKESFAELLARYEDYDMSPGNESLERIESKLRQAHTWFYIIHSQGKPVGAIRVVDKKDGGKKRIAPLFILPQFRRQGLAQAAIREAERLHGEHGWMLDTILQERGNCCLYEKMGYHQTGRTEKINERMTIVDYEKD